MLVNGYEIGEEPTREEFMAFFRVQAFFEREAVAQFLDAGDLTQDEFGRMAHWYHKGDFSAEEHDYMDYLRDVIIDERSQK